MTRFFVHRSISLVKLYILLQTVADTEWIRKNNENNRSDWNKNGFAVSIGYC